MTAAKCDMCKHGFPTVFVEDKETGAIGLCSGCASKTILFEKQMIRKLQKEIKNILKGDAPKHA